LPRHLPPNLVTHAIFHQSLQLPLAWVAILLPNATGQSPNCVSPKKKTLIGCECARTCFIRTEPSSGSRCGGAVAVEAVRRWARAVRNWHRIPRVQPCSSHGNQSLLVRPPAPPPRPLFSKTEGILADCAVLSHLRIDEMLCILNKTYCSM
jgi:hypothetical protein